jgi:hypothetical protein
LNIKSLKLKDLTIIIGVGTDFETALFASRMQAFALDIRFKGSASCTIGVVGHTATATKDSRAYASCSSVSYKVPVVVQDQVVVESFASNEAATTDRPGR